MPAVKSRKMRNIEKLDGLVLSRRDVGEADRLVTVLVPGRGVLRAFANGVRKIPSRRGGHCEPMTRVTMLLSGGSDRYSIGAIETQDYFQPLHGQASALEQAQRLSQLLLGLFEVDSGEGELFNVVERFWRRLPTEGTVGQALLEISVSWDLIRLAGLMPRLDACRVCGRTVPDSDGANLSIEMGWWQCQSCRSAREMPGVLMTKRDLLALRWLSVDGNDAKRLKMSPTEADRLIRLMRSMVGELLLSNRSRNPVHLRHR